MATLFGGEGSGLVLRSWVEQKVNLDPTLSTRPENPFCIRLPRSSSNECEPSFNCFLRLTSRDLPLLAPPVEVG